MAKETKIVDSQELCNILGISKATLWRRRKERCIPYMKLGGKVLFNVEKVIKAMEDNSEIDGISKDRFDY